MMTSNTTTTKRYVVFSKNTLAKTGTVKAMRKFETRADARAWKRTTGGVRYGIYDTVNSTVVR